MIHYLKQYPFSLLIICTICYLSLCTMPETELDDVPFIDKWVHICMYGGLSGVLWIEYVRAHRSIKFMKALLPTVIFPPCPERNHGIAASLLHYYTKRRLAGYGCKQHRGNFRYVCRLLHYTPVYKAKEKIRGTLCYQIIPLYLCENMS